MCSIVGYINEKVTQEDLKILKNVMIESQIRGKHASGIAWYNGTKIQSYIKAMPIGELVSHFNMSRLVHDGKVAMIAHARYSTSNLQFNQPIVSKNMAIAHNGVITQAPPEEWEELYGYQCKGENDSELLLHALESGDSLIKTFPDSSIAMVSLDSNGKLSYLRNHMRPLWKGAIGKGTVIASTYDILHRCGVTSISKVKSSDGLDLQKRSLKDGK